MSIYRRLGLLARAAHLAFGFLAGVALDRNPAVGIVAILFFLGYEFSEWLHDVMVYKKPYKWDFPDDELAEAAAGLLLYALLSWLGLP